MKCQSPNTEIANSATGSPNPANLRLLYHNCHDGIAMSHIRCIDPGAFALSCRLAARIDAPTPTRAYVAGRLGLHMALPGLAERRSHTAAQADHTCGEDTSQRLTGPGGESPSERARAATRRR